MSPHPFLGRLWSALRAVPPFRLIVLVLVALLAGLVGDWFRVERVVFPAPLPRLTTTPARP